MSRRRLVRLLAPAAFLIAVTISVLLIRAGLRGDEEEPREPAVAGRTASETRTTIGVAGPRQLQPMTYIVVEGDTLDQIALDFDTTLERLLELNPEVEPTGLRPGQRLRVP